MTFHRYSVLTVAFVLQHACICCAFKSFHTPAGRCTFQNLHTRAQLVLSKSSEPESPPTCTLMHDGDQKLSPSSSIDNKDGHGCVANLEKVQRWTQEALLRRGTLAGYQALENLGQVCRQRLPFDFAANQQQQPNIRSAPRLIPSHVSQQVSSIVKELEAEGLLSTNLDSVDGLPSFHLNLVSDGKPLFPKQLLQHNSNSPNTFGNKIQQLLDLVGPYIYGQLLPQAREVGGSRIQVSDVFLRRYGQKDGGKRARNGISAHYDVLSKVTCVIAMDNVAANGDNGLYTIQTNKGSTSNHASLRRFFPLRQGDGVLHTWDVLHGVDVLPGSDRTSLIVWFADECSEESTQVSHWLLEDMDRIKNDDVTQFVLAGALASAAYKEQEGGRAHEKDESAMCQSAPDLTSATQHVKSQELYLQSAASRNAFALSSVGSICEEEAWTSANIEKQAQDVLQSLDTAKRLPQLLHMDAAIPLSRKMAWNFWWEAALSGNPAAQFALADDLMSYTVSSFQGTNHDEFALLATVLFGLAAQQGMEDALDRLSKVISREVDRKEIATEEDYDSLTVVQTARAALS
jgi:hypothetical protein